MHWTCTTVPGLGSPSTSVVTRNDTVYCSWPACATDGAINAATAPRRPPAMSLFARRGHSTCRSTGPRHVLRHDYAVVVVLGEVAEGHRRFLGGEPVLVRVLGDGGCVVVADRLVEPGHQHERPVDVLGDLLPVGLYAFDREQP